MVVLRKNQKNILERCLDLYECSKEKIGILSCPLGFGKTIIGKKLIEGNKKELIITKEHLKKNWEGHKVISDIEFNKIENEERYDIVIFDDADILELERNKIKSKFIWMFSNKSDDFRYLIPIWEKNNKYVIKKGGNIKNKVILEYLKSIKDIDKNIVEHKRLEKNEQTDFFNILDLLRKVEKRERTELFKKYRLKYDIFETEAICPISGGKINNAIITTCCNNKFSEKEFSNWILDYRGNCPLCRNVIKDFEDIIFTNKVEINDEEEFNWKQNIMIYCTDEKICNLICKRWKLKNTNMNRINDFIKGTKNIFVVSNIKVIRGINLKIDTILFYKIDNKEIIGKFKYINPKLKSYILFNSTQLFLS